MSMVPPDGGYRPGQHQPPADDPLAAAARREEAERIVAMRRYLDRRAAQKKWMRLLALLAVVALAGWAAWRFLPREATHPTIAWDRRVGGDTDAIQPENEKLAFALASWVMQNRPSLINLRALRRDSRILWTPGCRRCGSRGRGAG